MNFSRLSFDVLDSTNTEAIRHARAGAEEGLLVTARQQRAGRGRQGRHWQTPTGNLAASFVLRPTVPVAQQGQLAFVAALAVGETLGHFGVDWELKWPNDVQVRGAKIAGILLEREDDWVVMGIGINVAFAPVVEGRTTNALSLLTSRTAGVDDVLNVLQSRLCHRYPDWQTHGFGPIREAWLSRAVGLGQTARVTCADGTIRTGIMQGMDETGALALCENAGKTLYITSGDVFFP